MKKNEIKNIFLCSSATQLSVYACLYKDSNNSMVSPENIWIFVCNPYCNSKSRSNIQKYSKILQYKTLKLSNSMFSAHKKSRINLISRRVVSNYELRKILNFFIINKHTVIEDGIGDYINERRLYRNSFHYIRNYLWYASVKTLSLTVKLIRLDAVSIFFLKEKVGLINKVKLPLIGIGKNKISSDIFIGVYKNISESYSKNFKLIILGSLYSLDSDKQMKAAEYIYKKINKWIALRGITPSDVFYMQHPRSCIDLEKYVSLKFKWITNNNQYITAEEVICANPQSTVMSTCSTSQIYAINILKTPCITVTNTDILTHSSFKNCSNYLHHLGAKKINLK